MSGTAAIIRTLQREPHREYTTTQLVEALYPRELRTLREQLEFGPRDRKRRAQLAKSALHRKALYHVGRLVTAGVLRVVRQDAHGEKVYAVVASATRPHGNPVQDELAIHLRPSLRVDAIEGDRERRAVLVFDAEDTLTRYNAIYVDASRVDGIGQTVRLAEIAIRLVNDVVAIGGLHKHAGRYQDEEIRDAISALAVLTLDEARRCMLLLDSRRMDVLPYVRALADLAPKRLIPLILVDGKSLQQESMQAALELARERLEKITVHYVPNREVPLFTGRAGPYGFGGEQWRIFSEHSEAPATVVTSASVCVDLERVGKLPPHEIRATMVRAADALFTATAQQRLIGTGGALLTAFHPDTASLVRDSTVALRVWNYDWEQLSPVLTSARPAIEERTREHAHVYRACGLAVHPHVQLTSAFTKFGAELSTRTYRKRTVTSSADLFTESFVRYREARRELQAAFDGIDRFRVFRAGSPSGKEIADELNTLGGAGLTLISYEFKALNDVRRLTEYFS